MYMYMHMYICMYIYMYMSLLMIKPSRSPSTYYAELYMVLLF